MFHPSLPGATLTPGFLLHAPVSVFRPVATNSTMRNPGRMPPVSFKYPIAVPDLADLNALQVLQIASQSLAANRLVRIPPFHDENPEVWRAVVIENVPRNTSSLDLLRLLKPKNLESIRKIRDGRGLYKAELWFMDHAAALVFYSHYILSPLALERYELMSIAWTPAHSISAKVQEPFIKGDLSRFLHLDIDTSPNEAESLDDNAIYQQLWNMLSAFGTLQKLVKAVITTTPNSTKKPSPQKNQKAYRALKCWDQSKQSGKIKLPTISTWRAQFVEAKTAMTALKEISWDRIKNIEFGSEEPYHKLEQQAALLFLMRSPYDPANLNVIDNEELRQALAYQSLASALIGILSGDEANIGNRCICISRLPPACRLVEVCNTVRGGMLESVKMIADKHVCFVTFLEATAAAQFWATYQMMPFYVNCERVRVGWGRNPGPLAPEIASVVNKSATRNVCIQFDSKVYAEGSDPVLDEIELGKIFAPFGIIEQVRVTQNVFCSFVTFANIINAVQAIDWARKSNRFPNCVVRFGKDRCAALPRCLAHNEITESPLILLLRRELTNMMSPAPVMSSPYAMPLVQSSPMTVPVAAASTLSFNQPSANPNQTMTTIFYGASTDEQLLCSQGPSEGIDSAGTVFGGLLQDSNK